MTNRLIFLLNVALAVLVVAIIHAVYHWFPVAYVFLITEDNLGEYLTAVAYLISFCVFGFLWIVKKDIRKPGFALLALLFLFVGMEEISWGQRIFNLRTPDILVKNNLQSELSLHNMLPLPVEMIFGIGVFLWMVILPCVSRRLRKWGDVIEGFGLVHNEPVLMPYFTIPLYFLFTEVVHKNGEIAEFLLGLVFFIFTLRLLWSNFPFRNKYLKARWALIAVLCIALVGSTWVLVKYRSDHNALRRRLNEFASEVYPKHNMQLQGEQTFRYILANTKFNLKDTRLNYAVLLKELHKNKEARQQFRLVIKECLKLSSEHPQEPAFHFIAGKAYAGLNKEALALKQFYRALAMEEQRVAVTADPEKKSFFLMNIGDIYCVLNNRDMAMAFYSKARETTQRLMTKRKIDRKINNVKILNLNQ